MANVYHPYRLQVLSPCVTVTGTVAHVRYEQDGDYHINVTLDPQYAGMINNANRKFEYGNLVVEIVPADQPGCVVGQPPRPAHGSYDYGICTGADLQVPLVGQRVRVTGPYVLDTDHGWREIHPVWRLVQAPS